MPISQAARDARAASLLNKNIDAGVDGIMPIRKFVELRLAQGYVPSVAIVDDKTLRGKLEKELHYLSRQGEPSGNPNWPATKRYNEVKAQLAQRIIAKAEYRLFHQAKEVWTVVTKTEYEYAFALSLAEKE